MYTARKAGRQQDVNIEICKRPPCIILISCTQCMRVNTVSICKCLVLVFVYLPLCLKQVSMLAAQLSSNTTGFITISTKIKPYIRVSNHTSQHAHRPNLTSHNLVILVSTLKVQPPNLNLPYRIHRLLSPMPIAPTIHPSYFFLQLHVMLDGNVLRTSPSSP